MSIANIVRLFVLVLIAASVGACSILGGDLVDKMADAHEKYCQEPQSARMAIREQYNAEAARRGIGSAEIRCSGDQ